MRRVCPGEAKTRKRKGNMPYKSGAFSAQKSGPCGIRTFPEVYVRRSGHRMKVRTLNYV